MTWGHRGRKGFFCFPSRTGSLCQLVNNERDERGTLQHRQNREHEAFAEHQRLASTLSAGSEKMSPSTKISWLWWAEKTKAPCCNSRRLVIAWFAISFQVILFDDDSVETRRMLERTPLDAGNKRKRKGKILQQLSRERRGALAYLRTLRTSK